MGRFKNALVVTAMVAASAAGGAAIAGAAGGSGSSTTATTTTPSTAPPANFPQHGTSAHEDAETPVTGDAAAKAKAAGVASLGGGTAGEVTTDFIGTGYEVTVTLSDGTTTEVHLDSSFTVMQHGGPPPPASGGSGNA
jgi:hypothetical protein